MGFKTLLHCSLRPTVVPTLSQMNPTHTIPVYALKILNNILPPMPKPSQSFLSFSSSHQSPVYIYLSHVCYMPHLSHSPSFDLPNNIWQKQKITKPPSWPQVFSSASCPQTPSVLFSQSDRPKFIPI
jgi:hypothetical protein